jgi:hypothetical protein
MVEANQEKLQAKMEMYLEQLETKREVNQEKTEAVAEHYTWLPHIKATCLLTAPECGLPMFTWSSYRSDIQGDYRGTRGLIWGPAPGHSIPTSTENKNPTQANRQTSLPSTLNRWLALHKDHVCGEAGKALDNSIT